MRGIGWVCAAMLLSGAAAPGATEPEGAFSPDLDAILERAQKTQQDDATAWGRYRFRREAVRENLDDAEAALDREDLEFIVTPVFGGFDEQLVREDGREPTADEVKRGRRLGLFNKHYSTLLSGSGGDDPEGTYSLSLLLHLSSYRYAGLDTVAGTPCYRIDFFPDERNEKRSLAARVASAMAGSLWITAEGFHLARAVAATVRPVPIAFSLAKVHAVKVSLEDQAVGEGVWLPRRIEIVTHARVLVKPIHRRNVYLYSAFEWSDPERPATSPGPPPHRDR